MQASYVLNFLDQLRTTFKHVRAADIEVFFRALAKLGDPGRHEIYWAGRLGLCRSEKDVLVYDDCFSRYFDGVVQDKTPNPHPEQNEEPGTSLAAADSEDDAAHSEDRLIAQAAEFERLSHADFSTLDTRQRDMVLSMIAALRVRPPLRRSHRHQAARRGELHAARTARAWLRSLGEAGDFHYVTARHKPRRCVLLFDISGSMRDYGDALTLFGYGLVTSMPEAAEVFAMGTRLTRLTQNLKRVSPDVARAQVAESIRDWQGGTRLGQSIKQFLDEWGQHRMVRQAVVIIASDGWESGEAAVLGAQMARLRRVAHRVVWINPHKSSAGFEPTAAGMLAALPHIDQFLGGASLYEFRKVAEIIHQLSDSSVRQKSRVFPGS